MTLLLSMRAAAKALGVSRGSLAELRRMGRLRTVPWFKGFKVPAAEVERLAREGVTATGRRPRPRVKRPAPGADEAARIAALDVEGL